jgi:acetyltransferase EpsM
MEDDMNVYLLGAGAHARETLCIYEDAGRIREVAGCFEQPCVQPGRFILGKPILDLNELTTVSGDIRLLSAIGSPRRREMIARALVLRPNASFDTIVHPTVVRSKSVQLGCGVTIAAACVLTCDILVRDHVILNTGCLVHHDAMIGPFVTLSPRVTICGGVKIGEGSFLGAGCTVIPGVSIGVGTYIGAGSVVTHDLPANCLAMGVPACVVKTDIKIEDIPVGAHSGRQEQA